MPKNRPPIISPNPKNVEALLAIPVPQTRRELRQFLGLAWQTQVRYMGQDSVQYCITNSKEST